MTTRYPLLADRRANWAEHSVIYIICLHSICHYKMTVISVKIHNKVSETSPPLKSNTKRRRNLISFKQRTKTTLLWRNQYVVPLLPVILRPTSKLSIKILKRTQTRQLLTDKKHIFSIRMKLIIYLERRKSFNGGTLSTEPADGRQSRTEEHTLSFNTHRDLKRFESAQMTSHVSVFMKFQGISSLWSLYFQTLL